MVLTGLSLLMLVAGTLLWAEDIYVAQTAQGSNTGADCANARSVAWFNTAGSWGGGPGLVSPGDTVRLCGTITTNLLFRASGTPGNYITVDGTGATMSAGVVETELSWWKVQNCTWSEQYEPLLMEIRGGSNGVFTGNRADNKAGGSIFLRQSNGLPHDIIISNNYIRTAAADFGDVQIDIIVTEGSYNVIIEGNYLEMRIANNLPHDDIIQTWEKGGASAGNPYDWTIRHNCLVMNATAANNRSWTMLESLSGTINIYGNLFVGISGASAANGINANTNRAGVVFNIFNNTIVAKNNASNNVFNLRSPGTANMRNNIVHAMGQTIVTGDMTIVRDHNLWFGTYAPSCNGNPGCLRNQDPLFTNYAGNDFTLQTGSPARGTGVDAGSFYGSGIIPGSTWPGPDLGTRTGNWDLGAYAYQTEGVLNRPLPVDGFAPPARPVPNPVTAAFLRHYARADHDWVLCDVNGKRADLTSHCLPGIFVIKGRGSADYIKVVIIK